MAGEWLERWLSQVRLREGTRRSYRRVKQWRRTGKRPAVAVWTQENR